MKATVHLNSGKTITLEDKTAKGFNENCLKWDWNKPIDIKGDDGKLQHVINLRFVEYVNFED